MIKWLSGFAGAALVVCTAAFAPTASAQSRATGGDLAASADQATTPSEFSRDRNVGVMERPRPEYQAQGIHAGGFMIYPRVRVDVVADDNIYAAPSGFRQSDTIIKTSPEVAIQSNWGRNALAFLIHGTFNNFSKHSTENANDYGAGATGRLDVVRNAFLSGGASIDQMTEARTDPSSPQAAAKPIRYTAGLVNGSGVWEINRTRWSAGFTMSDYTYENNRTAGGAFLRQNDRDRTEWTEFARGEYAVSPALAIFGVATINQRDYRLNPPTVTFDRNSTGYDIDVGTSFDLTHLIRGQIQVGYQSQSYSQTGFRSTSGLSYQALVDWFATPLTTFNVSASRSVQEAVGIGASGFVSSNVGLRVDHELLRNVVFGAHGTYGQDVYQGAPRTDNRTGAGLTLNYLMNRRVGFRVGYDYLKLNSTGASHINDYNDNKVSAGLTVQF